MNMQINLRFLTFALFLLAGIVMAWQCRASDTRDLEFHGTLRLRHCYINNNQLIEIHFGEIGVNKIDGNNYKQSIPYTVVCDDPSTTTQTLTLSMNGSGSSFDQNGVETSVSGLAIRLFKDGSPMELNKPFAITYSAPPVLEAAPEKDVSAHLTAQNFTAAATLLAEYQ